MPLTQKCQEKSWTCLNTYLSKKLKKHEMAQEILQLALDITLGSYGYLAAFKSFDHNEMYFLVEEGLKDDIEIRSQRDPCFYQAIYNEKEDLYYRPQFIEEKYWFDCPLYFHGQLCGVLAVQTLEPITFDFSLQPFTQVVTTILGNYFLADQVGHVHDIFLSTMSHELKTPLNGIVGMTNLLAIQPLNENQRDKIRVIENCSEQLNELINDIMDFSRLGTNQIHLDLKSFCLEELIQDTVCILEEKIKQKRLKFHLEINAQLPTWWLGDAVRIRQVLLNLLSNAIKFTHQGSVTCRVELIEQLEFSISEHSETIDDAQVQPIFPELTETTCIDTEDLEKKIILFKIIDTGMGIAEEDQRLLFKTFAQLKSNIHNEGVGLGLAICKKLSRIMHGQVYLEKSQLGQGTTMCFQLPLPVVNYPPNIPKTINQIHWDSKNIILIVEDNPNNTKVAIEMLKSLGLPEKSIYTAPNGVEAVKKCSNYFFSLIFMDIKMPIMDGFQASKQILQLAFAQSQFKEYFKQYLHLRPTIVAMTAMDKDWAQQKKCQDFGMSAFLAKPIKRDEMQVMLQIVQEKRQESLRKFNLR